MTIIVTKFGTMFQTMFDHCEICKKKVNELRSFTSADIIALDLDWPVYLNYQTSDGKLGYTYRGVSFYSMYNGEIAEQRQVEKYWMCFDCLTADPDEIEKRLQDEDWIAIPMSDLRPMDELGEAID